MPFKYGDGDGILLFRFWRVLGIWYSQVNQLPDDHGAKDKRALDGDAVNSWDGRAWPFGDAAAFKTQCLGLSGSSGSDAIYLFEMLKKSA